MTQTMMHLPAFTIATVYPCCNRRARFHAIAGVPRERYIRRCAPCETTWDVARDTRLAEGIRIDRVTWLDTKDQISQRRYGR